MPQQELDELTKEWILNIIFLSGKTMDYGDLIENGCKIMIYGHKSFDDIERLVEELIDGGYMYRNGNTLRIDPKGIFEIKSKTLIPLQKLLENKRHYAAFILANKEKCDIAFLEDLIGQSPEHFQRAVLEKGVDNYNELSKVSRLVVSFLDNIKNGGHLPINP